MEERGEQGVVDGGGRVKVVISHFFWEEMVE